MSLDIVNAFVYLLQNERHIFQESEEKLSDFSTTLPDNVEQIANSIIAWCKEQGIYDNLCNALPQIPTKVGGKPNNLTAKECQDLIKNATRTESKENDHPPASNPPSR